MGGFSKIFEKIMYNFLINFIEEHNILYKFQFGTASDIHLQSLIKLQKKIVRIIHFSSYNSPTKIIFQQLNILLFKKIVFQRLALQMFKYEFGIIPLALPNLFEKIVLFIHITLYTGTNFDLL